MKQRQLPPSRLVCRALGFSLGLAAVWLLPAAAAAQTDYQIGPQDVLTITVFGEADLSGKYTVEQDGTFTFPLVGRIKAGGLTLRDVEADLKKKLADGYLKNPQLTVSIETYRSQRILVMGEVCSRPSRGPAARCRRQDARRSSSGSGATAEGRRPRTASSATAR